MITIPHFYYPDMTNPFNRHSGLPMCKRCDNNYECFIHFDINALHSIAKRDEYLKVLGQQ